MPSDPHEVKLYQTQAPGTTQGVVEGLGIRGRVNMPLLGAIVPVTIIGGSPDESHLGTVALVGSNGDFIGEAAGNPLLVQVVESRTALVDVAGAPIGVTGNPLVVEGGSTPVLMSPITIELQFGLTSANSFTDEAILSPPAGVTQWAMTGLAFEQNNSTLAVIRVDSRQTPGQGGYLRYDNAVFTGAAGTSPYDVSNINASNDPVYHRSVRRWSNDTQWRVVRQTGATASIVVNLYFEAFQATTVRDGRLVPLLDSAQPPELSRSGSERAPRDVDRSGPGQPS